MIYSTMLRSLRCYASWNGSNGTLARLGSHKHFHLWPHIILSSGVTIDVFTTSMAMPPTYFFISFKHYICGFICKSIYMWDYISQFFILFYFKWRIQSTIHYFGKMIHNLAVFMRTPLFVNCQHYKPSSCSCPYNSNWKKVSVNLL